MNNILDTITKLLRLANDAGATEGEAQAALGRVAHLARTHNISDVEIQRAQRADGTEGVRIHVNSKDMVDKPVHDAKTLSRWDRRILTAVAEASTCGSYVSYRFGRQTAILYGLPADVAVGKALFEFCRKALSRATRRFTKELREQTWEQIQSNSVEGRTFKDGFVRGLYEAARAARKAAETATDEKVKADVGSAFALVAVSDVQAAKRTALRKAYQERGLVTSRRRSRSVQWGGSGAYDAGHAAGRATDLRRSAIQ